jgi:ribosomal protein L4
MSKAGKVKTNEVVKETNNVVESEDKTKDAIESLKVQFEEHTKQSDYHKTMATKAQGALEVLLQLYPEENN